MNRSETTAANSLAELYQRHADFAWRTLRRLGVTEADASDAVQDVFLVVHQKLAQFKGQSSMTTWLFTICRTVARQRRRHAQARRALDTDASVDEELDLRADVARAAEHNERLALLDAILASFEVEQKNVFILFEIEKMTGEEISEALSIPLGTVYSRLTLARKAFRQALTRDEARARFCAERAGGTP
ncbi:MAG TPA: sigma-70 family RNA polymerase sigma factor [Polyangiaceae bacterium]|jgi:RNA polymerase sigma-70 factor (ECF subfamily)|nr:sigma-70 family RNA polymerase sigma factor [Polyangiaceae bacterium]